MKLKKFEGNPILKPNNNQWENLCVLNPAVIYAEEREEFVMLYRAAGDTYEHYIYLGLATSKDGYNFERFSDKPIFEPDYNGADGGCVEDPRLVKMGDTYYLTYASRPYAPGRYWLHEPKPWFNPPKNAPQYLRHNDTITSLAFTKDFINYKKCGRMTNSRVDDRDVFIFPEMINGKYVRFSRPMTWCGEGYPCKNPSIWIAFSDDLLEWGTPELFYQGKTWWEDKKVGGSCPPIKTEDGWFFIYHGVSTKDNCYRVGAMLLDLEDPRIIKGITKDFIMEPEFDYELSGPYNGCVFPTGNVVKDGILYVYYGAADKYVCLATANFNELLEELKKQGK